MQLVCWFDPFFGQETICTFERHHAIESQQSTLFLCKERCLPCTILTAWIESTFLAKKIVFLILKEFLYFWRTFRFFPSNPCLNHSLFSSSWLGTRSLFAHGWFNSCELSDVVQNTSPTVIWGKKSFVVALPEGKTYHLVILPCFVLKNIDIGTPQTT